MIGHFMKTIIYIILGIIAFFLLIGIVWRLLSQRMSLACPSWLGWMVERDNPFAKVSTAKFIIEQLYLQPEVRIVDIGCGPGRVTIPLAKKIGSNGSIVAMDIQQGMLQQVEEKAKAAHLNNIRFLNAGIGEGKLEHNYYDYALLVTVLGEIPDQHAALQETFDALKPGGILSVTELIFDPHFQRKGTVIKLATAVGFQEKNSFGGRLAYTMHLQKPVNI
jgi:ubiquinone/menaquinone biosynthesis C-methylase UbiE